MRAPSALVLQRPTGLQYMRLSVLQQLRPELVRTGQPIAKHAVPSLHAWLPTVPQKPCTVLCLQHKPRGALRKQVRPDACRIRRTTATPGAGSHAQELHMSSDLVKV